MWFVLPVLAASPYQDADARPEVVRTGGTGKDSSTVVNALKTGLAGEAGVEISHCWTLRDEHPVVSPSVMTLSARLVRSGRAKGVRLLEGSGFPDVDECVVEAFKGADGFRYPPYPERLEFDLRLPPRPTPDDAPIPSPEYLTSGQLDNGLRYWIRTVPHAPTTLNLAVGVGASNEAPGEAGFAHLLEHMAFLGTTRFDKQTLSKSVFNREYKATHSNAFTSMDQTVYMISVPVREDWSDAMDVMRDWAAAEFTFEDGGFGPERDVVIEEWRRSLTPRQRLFAADRAFHAPGVFDPDRGVLGRLDSLRDAESAALRAFLERWYRPDNMALIVTSRENGDVVEKQILERFSGIPSANVPMPERPMRYVAPPSETEIAVIEEEGYTGLVELAFVSAPVDVPQDHGGLRDGFERQLAMMRLYFGMVGRIDEKSPIVRVSSYWMDVSPTQRAWYVGFRIDPSQVDEGLTLARDLLYSTRRETDWTRSDHEIVHEWFLYRNRFFGEFPNARHDRHTRNLLRRHLAGHEPLLGDGYEYDLLRAWLPQFRYEQANAIALGWFDEPHRISLSGPPGLPSEASLRELLDEDGTRLPILDREDEVPDPEEPDVLPVATVLNQGPTYRTVRYPNGLTARLAPTWDNTMVVMAFRPGGEGEFTREDRLAWNALLRSEAGERPKGEEAQKLRNAGVALEPIWDRDVHGFTFRCPREDAQRILSWAQELLDRPALDPEVAKRMVRASRRPAEQAEKLSVLLDEATVGLKPLVLEDGDAAADVDVLRERLGPLLGSPADWTVVLAGDLPGKASVDRLAALSLGTLSFGGEPMPSFPTPPQSTLDRIVTSEVNPDRTDVRAFFHTEIVSDLRRRAHLDVLAELIEVKALEVLRAELSGTYIVSASSHWTEAGGVERGGLVLDFSCSPERADELTEQAKGIVTGWLAEGQWSEEQFKQAKHWAHGRHPVRARHMLTQSLSQWRAGELGALDTEVVLDRSEIEATAALFAEVEKTEARLIPK